jgi:hypothetical protein
MKTRDRSGTPKRRFNSYKAKNDVPQKRDRREKLKTKKKTTLEKRSQRSQIDATKLN